MRKAIEIRSKMKKIANYFKYLTGIGGLAGIGGISYAIGKKNAMKNITKDIKNDANTISNITKDIKDHIHLHMSLFGVFCSYVV